jgi:hypothetical protein
MRPRNMPEMTVEELRGVLMQLEQENRVMLVDDEIHFC